jgi:hypothetical protein
MVIQLKSRGKQACGTALIIRRVARFMRSDGLAVVDFNVTAEEAITP